MNPYLSWIKQLDAWIQTGGTLPLGGFSRPERFSTNPSAPKVLLFSPHPDDECIIGALPLRMGRQGGFQILNIAVTLGSNPARQAARREELQKACDYLGWGLECAAPQGLLSITPKARETEPEHWLAAVACIREIMQRHQPRFIVFPHAADWNGTHIGTHLLIKDALSGMPPGFACVLIETEFWGAMAAPNLMVESSLEEVAELVAATSFHVGEVQRNPYHLTLPAWMQDNVRRGGELVGGQGGAAPAYRFATLYRTSHWSNGEQKAAANRFLPAGHEPLREWAQAMERSAWK